MYGYTADLIPKLPPMSAGTTRRSDDVGIPRAPATTGAIENGPWKLAWAVISGPSGPSRQSATTT